MATNNQKIFPAPGATSQPEADPPVMIWPIRGLPEITPGDDLARGILDGVEGSGLDLEDGDVIVVAQKIISKAENARVVLAEIDPSPLAVDWAKTWDRDPRLVELVLRECRRIVRMERGLIITETRHGFVCANAGIDLSNTGEEDVAILLPKDPDLSAQKLRDAIREIAQKEVAIIIADTFGRPWRRGLTQAAIGVAGILPLLDLCGTQDADGRELHATELAVADQLADAAELVCGKSANIPAALIRNYQGPRGEGRAAELVREPGKDLFR